METTAGDAPQLSMAVDAGTYCAEIYDARGEAESGVTFSMTIEHP